jgi:hypothetical protein
MTLWLANILFTSWSTPAFKQISDSCDRRREKRFLSLSSLV